MNVRGAGMRGMVNDSVYVRENNRACAIVSKI